MTVLPNLQQEIDALKSEIARLKTTQATGKLTLKVGQSGTLCLYHGARYPIALYREQWERILPFLRTDAVDRFIATNTALLSTKG